MKTILGVLLVCVNILQGSILEMVCQLRDELVHRPGCGWGRQEACVWLNGGGSMLDLVVAFREMALREGIATKIVLGRVSLSEEQVKAWLPWEAGAEDIQLDDFGGGGNGVLAEDGRYEFDMAWLRCHVQYAPAFGTVGTEAAGGGQWIDVFPALLGCERSEVIGNSLLEEASTWRREVEEAVEISQFDGKEACTGYPLTQLTEKRRELAGRLSNSNVDMEPRSIVKAMPGYASHKILGTRPVRILNVYGEYDELPLEYMTQIVVDIIRDNKIVCELSIPQTKVRPIALRWLARREGSVICLEKGRKVAGLKALPQLSSGEVHVVGQGPFEIGEAVAVRFQRRLGGKLLEEIYDRISACEQISYGLSMGYGECEAEEGLPTWENHCVWLRKRHDAVRRLVMGLWGCHEEAGLCVSKVLEGVRLSGSDGTVVGYIQGAGELGGNRLIERNWDVGWRWVMKAACGEASSSFLRMLLPNASIASPWIHLVETAADGGRVVIGKGSDLSSDMFGKEEVVIADEDCLAGGNSGCICMDGRSLYWQISFTENDDQDSFTDKKLTDSLEKLDDVDHYVLWMLCGLDGDDGWLGGGMAGWLTALAMFDNLSDLRDSFPIFKSFSLEREHFQRGKANVKLEGSGAESWTLRINSSDGLTIRTYNGNGSWGDMVWDGCDDDGKMCPDGIYQFNGTLSNGDIHVSRTVVGEMDTSLPIVQLLAWLEKDASGQNVMYAEYLAEDQHVGVIDATLRDVTEGKLLETWMMEDCRGRLSFAVPAEMEGVYEWTVKMVDLAGNEGVATAVVKSGVYCSGEVWSLQEAGKEELKVEGVTAELSQPMEGSEIDTEVVRVYGTATAAGDVRYMLRLWDADGKLLPCVAEERQAGWLLKFAQNGADDPNQIYKTPHRRNTVVDGLLGILDVSGLSNGRYRLELVVMGDNGTSNALRDIYLEKRIRNGVFEFSEVDGAVSVGGMEMKLRRSYSSGELRNGEMGYGWTWSLASTGGTVDDERETICDVVGNTVSVRCGGSRDVSLTLPDGRRCTYRFSLEEGGGWSFAYYAVWSAPSNVKATLRPVVSNKLMTLPGMEPYWEATGPECDWELYDFPGFVLMDVDGTTYEYGREPLGEAALLGDDGGSSFVECYGDLRLRAIRKPEGDCWLLNDNNVLYMKADGGSREVLQMERDGVGRITKLLKWDGDGVLYDYDDSGNLLGVVKKTAGKETGHRQYEYADERFPHHLTGVQDGRGVRLMSMEYDSSGGYCGMRNADGAGTSAVRDALDGYELQTDCYGHETLFGYDRKGQMILKIEADGGRTQIEYDEAGHEIRRTDPLGRSVVQAFDAQGNLTSRKTGGGDVTRYDYNGDGQCTRLVDSGGRVMEAEYDASGHASKVVTPTGLVIKRRFSADGLLEADLDENGEELTHYEHDREGRTTAMTDYVGGTRQEFLYDGHGKLSRMELRSFNPETGDVETYGLFYERDDDGNVISTHDSLGEWTQIVREDGMVVEKRMSNGLHLKYRYDVAERCVEELDMARQMVTRTVYDIGGRVIVKAGPEPVGLAGGEVPASVVFSSAWFFDYDVVGRPNGRSKRTNVVVRLVKTVENRYSCELADNGMALSEERTEHDLAGQIIREVSTLGYETRYLYDHNGNCIAVTDHDGYCRRRELDGLGNVVLMVDGTGHETKMEYDDAGRLRKTCFPDGSEWTTVHDKNGHLTKQTDGEGRTTVIEYALGNRPAQVVLPETGGEAPVYRYGYDSCGNFLSMTDPLGRVRRFERDAVGRVVSETSPFGKIKQYLYLGRSGLITSLSESGGRHTEWKYDELGRVVKCCAWANGEVEEPDFAIESAYDDYGRLMELTSGDTHRRFTYNVDGKLVGVMDNETPLWEAAYNEEGALSRLVGSGTDIGYARGQHRRLEGMTMLAGGGAVLAEPWAVSYRYDANGQVVQSMMSDGWCREYVYDTCGRCTGVIVWQGEEVVYHVQYTLDKNGRRVAAVEKNGNVERNLSWGYDELGRLLEEHVLRSDGLEDRHWCGRYDAAGNLLEEEWRSKGTPSRHCEWQVDDDDQLVKMVDTDENGRCETWFEWNGNGELVKAETTGGRTEKREWTWSAEGRLQEVSIVTPSKRTTVSFEYDLDGVLRHQRIICHENGREHVLERDFLFETVTSNGLPMLLEMKEKYDGMTRLVSYFRGHGLEGWMEDGRFCHVWSDVHGGLRGLELDGLIERYAYDSWGVELVGHDGVGYAGEWQDEASGLVYLRGRFYWPKIRRFISADAHPADFMKPQTWHRYAYCLNDPVNGRDPQGTFAMSVTMGMTLRLLAFYTCFKFAVNWYYDIYHADMMRSLLEIRRKYHENAAVVVHGVTEHEVNWSEAFSEKIERLTGNQDMYEFLWSGFQCGGFVLFVPNPLSHIIAVQSLVCYLCELYMKGYSDVNVLAHSWGTVLSRDAMSQSGLSFGLWATMGSPLGQTQPMFQYRKWQNFFSPADGVTQLAPLLCVMGYEDSEIPLYMQKNGVEQHLTLCMNPITAHSSYWTDPTVFNDLITALKWR